MKWGPVVSEGVGSEGLPGGAAGAAVLHEDPVKVDVPELQHLRGGGRG